MKRGFDARIASPFAFILALGTGCDAQVGEGYEGEPLLSLKGTVVLRDAEAREDMVPTLVPFFPYENEYTFPVIDGEVTGDFPAKFRFDVMTPPPERSILPMHDYSGKLLGHGTIASLAMLPRNHSGLLAGESHELCPDTEATCIENSYACVGERCRTTTYECVREDPCESLGSVGNAVDGQELGPMEAVISGDTLYLAQTSCTRGGECLSELKSCRLGPASSLNPSFDLPVKNCTQVADMGDPTVVSTRSYQSFARNFIVFYAVEGYEFDGHRLKSGYNLIEILPMTPEIFQQRMLCRTSAPFEAVTDYNQTHGTTFTLSDDLPDELQSLVLESRVACDDDRYRLIENPLGESLTITLGASPAG
jgi:hypothetical protein